MNLSAPYRAMVLRSRCQLTSNFRYFISPLVELCAVIGYNVGMLESTFRVMTKAFGRRRIRVRTPSRSHGPMRLTPRKSIRCLPLTNQFHTGSISTQSTPDADEVPTIRLYVAAAKSPSCNDLSMFNCGHIFHLSFIPYLPCVFSLVSCLYCNHHTTDICS